MLLFPFYVLAAEAVLVLASASDAPLPSSMDGAPPGGVNHAALKWEEGSGSTDAALKWNAEAVRIHGSAAVAGDAALPAVEPAGASADDAGGSSSRPPSTQARWWHGSHRLPEHP